MCRDYIALWFAYWNGSGSDRLIAHGDLNMALELQQSIVEVQARVLGAEHPTVKEVYADLAEMRKIRGMLTENQALGGQPLT